MVITATPDHQLLQPQAQACLVELQGVAERPPTAHPYRSLIGFPSQHPPGLGLVGLWPLEWLRPAVDVDQSKVGIWTKAASLLS